MDRRPMQYSLGALFALLTVLSLVLGYVRFVGIWRFTLALGPPLLVAAIANYIMSPETAGIPRASKEYREREVRFPASVRVLFSLVMGLVVWLPVLLVLTLM